MYRRSIGLGELFLDAELEIASRVGALQRVGLEYCGGVLICVIAMTRAIRTDGTDLAEEEPSDHALAAVVEGACTK